VELCCSGEWSGGRGQKVTMVGTKGGKVITKNLSDDRRYRDRGAVEHAELGGVLALWGGSTIGENVFCNGGTGLYVKKKEGAGKTSENWDVQRRGIIKELSANLLKEFEF